MSDKAAEVRRLRVRIMEYEARAAMSRTGREFVREVGADPRKWAEAFDEAAGKRSAETGGFWPHNREERIEYLAQWFQDAMEAACKASRLAAPPLFPEEDK